MRITVDAGKLTKGLDDYFDSVKRATTNSLVKTGYTILDAAEPKAPIDEGTLIGSGYVQVGAKTFQNDSTTPKPQTTAKDTQLNVGYTVEYAAKLHENPFNPGAKSKQKGLVEPGYKWLINAARKLDIVNIFKEFLNDELKRK